MKPAISIPAILDRLEGVYGEQHAAWPVEPYDFLVWWHCGYPASDDRCAKGWNAVSEKIGTSPQELLKVSTPKLVAALAAGGMVPELRAERLKEIARHVVNEFGGDLRTGLIGDVKAVRKLLKSFPNIADPGADRIMLFGELAPLAAVPSNCPHVLVRILSGAERENYGVTYKESQAAIEAQLPKTFGARQRAYLLLKQHGQKTCKLTNPKCETCVLREECAFANGTMRGRSSSPAKRKASPSS
jgi:endonuclease-3